MDFAQWLEYGINNKWCTKSVCETHNGLPTSAQEDELWEQGEDPCIHVVRLVESPELWDEITKNYPENYSK